MSAILLKSVEVGAVQCDSNSITDKPVGFNG